MNIKKKSFAFALIFLLLYTHLFSIVTYANTEQSITVKLSLLNVKPITDGEYTHEIDLPKDFGAFINYTFDKTGQHTATGIKSVVFDATRNKLLVTFTMGSGKVNDVDGYANRFEGLFKATPYNAACRYSDGARWQLNEFRSTDLLPIYTIYDFTSSTNPVPTDFVFDKYRVTGKTTLNYKNEIVGHWVDSKGTTYSNDQIDIDTKTVNQDALTFPSALKVSNIDFSKFTKDDPSLIYNYLTASLTDVKNSEDSEAAWLRPSIATTVMTGHAKCQNYVYQFEYYVTAKTMPVNNIEGTFTFRYTATDEPKIIATIEANPSTIKFNNTTITVDVTLKAEVVNIPAGAIERYILYLRTEDNTQNPMPNGYIQTGKTLTTQVTTQFTIPASKLANKEEFTEYFVGRVYADTTNASVGRLMSDLVKTSTLVYKDSPITVIENHDIVAKIQGNAEVKVGDSTTFTSIGSYSTGSAIVGYKWELPNAIEQPSGTFDAMEDSFRTWYSEEGKERAILYVVDEQGRQAGAFMDFMVVAPTIEATIRQGGTLKENRRVTFTAEINTPTRYPIKDIDWKIQSLDSNLNTHIRHENSLTGKTSIEALFKMKGEYLVTLNVTNTAGYAYEATYVVEIKEDKAPAVDFDFQQKVYRDPTNGNQATFELTDYSYSFDGDTVEKRNWYVIFDANNDGVFNEAQVLFSSGNETQVSYNTTHVGKYHFILEAIEEFGEETIDAYVTESDRRRLKTTDW